MPWTGKLRLQGPGLRHTCDPCLPVDHALGHPRATAAGPSRAGTPPDASVFEERQQARSVTQPKPRLRGELHRAALAASVPCPVEVPADFMTWISGPACTPTITDALLKIRGNPASVSQ